MQSINNFLLVKKEIKKEERSEGGIILTIPSAFDFGEQFEKRNIIHAEVMYANPKFPFLQAGDRIVLNPNKGQRVPVDYEDFTAILSDQVLAKIDSAGNYFVHPDKVMIKIKKEDSESLYAKWITRNDGSKVQLFIQPEPEQHAANRSQIFVSLGEIMQVGEKVVGQQTYVAPGDIAILDYTVDNFTDNILFYDDDGNKIIVIDGNTTYHENDEWVYASRRHPKDTLVARKGDMITVSPLLGVIRSDIYLIAIQPYVFLEHLPSVVEKVSQSGIMYSEKENIIERKVLSVSLPSRWDLMIDQGHTVVVKDVDVFDVKLKDGKIQCVLEQDILMVKNDSTGS